MSNLSMQGGATGTGTVTLLAPVTSTNRTLTLPDATGTLLSTATAGVPVNGPAFSAYMTNGSANQSIASATFTKVKIDTEEFDTNSNFDSTTNYRFTPTVAGYYQVSGAWYLSYSASNPTNFVTSIYKNGAAFKNSRMLFSSGTSAALYGISTVSSLIYLNGSTDYVELYAFQAPSTDGVIVFGQTNTYFSAAMVRGA